MRDPALVSQQGLTPIKEFASPANSMKHFAMTTAEVIKLVAAPKNVKIPPTIASTGTLVPANPAPQDISTLIVKAVAGQKND